ncbi:MAG: twin-arginine translocase TatA/TatE family subunit [Nitrospira sp.]|nr:twin-arginine translocase TatA/TatE family subunit [Nitrospira sp.]
MFGLGLPELIVILVIIMIIFGVGRLAGIGPALGKAIRGFKKGLSGQDEEASVEKKKEDS